MSTVIAIMTHPYSIPWSPELYCTVFTDYWNFPIIQLPPTWNINMRSCLTFKME